MSEKMQKKPNLNTKQKEPSKKIFIENMLRYSKKYWKHVLLIVLASLLSSVALMVVPLVVNKVIVLITNPKVTSETIVITRWIILIVALILVSALFTFIQNYVGALFGTKVEIDLRTKTINHLLDLDMEYYQNSKSGEALTRLISDTDVVGTAIQRVLASIVSSGFKFVGAIIVIFILNWIVGLTILIFSLTILIFMAVTFTFIRKRLHKARKVYTDINSTITDRMAVISLIKSFHTESYEKKRIFKTHDKFYTTNKKAQLLLSMTIALAITALTGLSIVSLITSFILIINHIMPAVTMISVGNAVGQLIFPLIGIATMFSMLANASVSLQRIGEILNIKISLLKPKNPIKIDAIDNGVRFDNVSFKYPKPKNDIKTKNDTKENQNVLTNFSYFFEKNKSYAIVGTTGAGKTTIIKLLLRYYDPTSGSILINNKVDLKQIDMKSYLNLVGYVEQEPQIFFGSIYENIVYGNFSATKEETYAAAKKANIHGFIMELPKGYDTIVGERGIMLSGGQKQRIVIARMFLKNPDLLIMDEATSSLDNIVEREIQSQIDILMKNRISIIVAHRLSTIKNVDQIIVIDKNMGIIQTGKFDELVAEEGFFNKLYLSGIIT